MKTRFTSALVAAALAAVGASTLALTGCSTAPRSTEGRSEIRTEADRTVTKARANDPSLGALMTNSAGYAVFPVVGKGAVGVGGAYGKGVLYENGIQVGYCDLSQASIGLQLGGQGYSEIIVFENKAAVDKFKTGNFAFDAQASAVALRSGAGANAKYDKGVAVFTMNEAGLMYEASIGGQKFTYEPM